jgi:subtilisin-like proprotein convertase family protein
MKTVSKLVCIAGLVGLAATASAQVYTYTFNVPTADQTIPDGDPNGTVHFGNVNALPGGYTLDIDKFIVRLDIEGDPLAGNGDLYAYLRSPDGQKIAYLLNRPGVPLNNGVGYQDNGLNVRLYDGKDDPNHIGVNGQPVAFSDVHYYQDDRLYYNKDVPNPDQITGIFKSDGRTLDPQSTPGLYSSATRDKTMSVFQGINPAGNWSLFIADITSGGSAKLVSWGLDFVPIPEPQEYALAIGAALMAFGIYRRRLLKSA